MSKKHDENKDIRLVSRIAKIDYSNKTIQASTNAIIGIRTWGRIDYLTHYCGWSFVRNNQIIIAKNINEDNDLPRKKVKKEKTLTKPNAKQTKRK